MAQCGHAVAAAEVGCPCIGCLSSGFHSDISIYTISSGFLFLLPQAGPQPLGLPKVDDTEVGRRLLARESTALLSPGYYIIFHVEIRRDGWS